MTGLQRLNALVVQRAGRPFAWGTSDCAMWAFDAAFALTGRDPAEDLRGTYSSALVAMRKLKAEGGWHAVCARRVGMPVATGEAVDGDVLLLPATVCSDEMAPAGALAVHWKGMALAQGAQGLVQVSAHLAMAAWRPRRG